MGIGMSLIMTLIITYINTGYDKEYIKKIAQEKFHMVKPGEKVFRVIDRKKIK